MAKPERILRLSGIYYRNQDYSEEEFHDFLSHHHGVDCAKVHAIHGILGYKMAFSTQNTRALAESMNLPYKMNTHDLEIEYYFKDVAALIEVSADEKFKALHVECLPYIDPERVTTTCTWIEAYLEDGKLVNIDSEGRNAQPSFAELNDIKPSEKQVDKY